MNRALDNVCGSHLGKLDDGERGAASVDETTLVDAAAAYRCALALRSCADTDRLSRQWSALLREHRLTLSLRCSSIRRFQRGCPR